MYTDELGHKIRFSDSSLYDFVCVLCGATDAVSDLRLGFPCPRTEVEEIKARKYLIGDKDV